MGVVPIRLIVQRYEEEAKATNFDCVFFIQQTIVSELAPPTASSPLDELPDNEAADANRFSSKVCSR